MSKETCEWCGDDFVTEESNAVLNYVFCQISCEEEEIQTRRI